jgi:hypothetical protein
MVPHPKVVIGTPYDDFAADAAITPACIGRPGGISLEIGEDAIATLAANVVEICMKMVAQCHRIYSTREYVIRGRSSVHRITKPTKLIPIKLC